MQTIVDKLREKLSNSGVTVSYRSGSDNWVTVPHGSRVTYLSGRKCGVDGNRVEVPIRDGYPSVQVLASEVLDPPNAGVMTSHATPGTLHWNPGPNEGVIFKELCIIEVPGDTPKWGAILWGEPTKPS